MAISTLIRSEGTPWQDLGTKYNRKIKTSKEIVEEAQLDWTVNAAHMYTNEFGEAKGWYSIYRQDSMRELGVVHSNRLIQTQNVDMFNSIEPILADGSVELDTTARFGNTDKVFGTFELTEQFEILGDKMTHYLVVINDHLKPDGRITVLNTPVRVACQNVLAEAISKNLYHIRIPVARELTTGRTLAAQVIANAQNAMRYLNNKAEKMVAQKMTDTVAQRAVEILFPTPESANIDLIATTKATEVDMMREIFIEDYLNADNLQNFKGTHYGFYQAITDFAQHAWKSADNAYNLDKRMSTLPNIGEKTIVQRYLAIANDLLSA